MSSSDDDTGAFLISEEYIHRKYAIIPSDQQELLSRPDAWNTRGIPNVPPQVLQDAKDAYAWRPEKSGPPTQATPVKSQPARPKGSSHQPRDPCGPGTEDIEDAGDADQEYDEEEEEEEEEGEEEEEQEERIPWSVSPTQHKRTPVRNGAEPKTGGTGPGPGRLAESIKKRDYNNADSGKVLPPGRLERKTAQRLNDVPAPSSSSPVSASPTPSHNVLRQVPRETVRPAPAINPKPRFAQQAPPSSLASEPELEYQPPKPVTVPADPVSRVIRSGRPPAPTPPSAQEQVTVPCTWKEYSSPARPQPAADQPQAKRRRLMKPPKFDSSQRSDQVPIAPPSGSKAGAIELDDPQTSNSNSVASINDMPLAGPPRRELAQAAVLQSSPPAPVVRAVHEGQSSISVSLPPNGPASQAPFVAYTVAYPDYEGTLGDFVRAVVSILHLQERRSLAEFLYDDFVRVFAHEYLDYIVHWDDEHTSKPLTTLQWYNEHVPRPLYTKGVLTRGNISDVLQHYRQKAESACRSAALRPSTSTPSLPSSTIPPVADVGAQQLRREALPRDSSPPDPTPIRGVMGFCAICWGYIAPFNKTSHHAELHVYCRSCQRVYVGLQAAYAHMRLNERCYSGCCCIRCGDGSQKIQADTMSAQGQRKHSCAAEDALTTSRKRFCGNDPCGALLETEEDAKRHFASCTGLAENRRANGLVDLRTNKLIHDGYSLVTPQEESVQEVVHGPPLPVPRQTPARGPDDFRNGPTHVTPQRQSSYNNDMCGIIRPTQIERVEPLRSVKGYVITISPAGSSARKGVQLKEVAAPPDKLDVKEGGKSVSPSQPPPSKILRSSPSTAQVEAQWKAPAPPQLKSPLASFPSVLTQPPATADSFISDFTRAVESIPETAIKPKDVPRSSHEVSALGASSTLDSRKPPSSSAVSATARSREKKVLTKNERFAQFLKKRAMQSSLQSTAGK